MRLAQLSNHIKPFCWHSTTQSIVFISCSYLSTCHLGVDSTPLTLAPIGLSPSNGHTYKSAQDGPVVEFFPVVLTIMFLCKWLVNRRSGLQGTHEEWLLARSTSFLVNSIYKESHKMDTIEIIYFIKYVQSAVLMPLSELSLSRGAVYTSFQCYASPYWWFLKLHHQVY